MQFGKVLGRAVAFVKVLAAPAIVAYLFVIKVEPPMGAMVRIAGVSMLVMMATYFASDYVYNKLTSGGGGGGGEVAKLRSHINKLRATLRRTEHDKQREIDELRETVKHVEFKLLNERNEKELFVERLLKRYQLDETESNSLRAELARFNSTLLVADGLKENEDLKLGVEILRSKCEKYRRLVDKLKTDLQEQAIDFHETREGLEKELELVNENAERATSLSEDLFAVVESLNNELRAKNSEIEAFESQLGAYRRQIEALKADKEQTAAGKMQRSATYCEMKRQQQQQQSCCEKVVQLIEAMKRKDLARFRLVLRDLAVHHPPLAELYKQTNGWQLLAVAKKLAIDDETAEKFDQVAVRLLHDD